MGYYVNTITREGPVGGPKYELGFQYPQYSTAEHLWSFGVWVGARVNIGTAALPRWIIRVTETNESDSIGRGGIETFPIDYLNSWFVTSTLRTDEPNNRDIDDDGDGLIDEDDLDGIDNDGDGFVDEDYGAVSENDRYCIFADTARIPAHVPLGLKFVQKSYAWADLVRQPILPFDLFIVNLGIHELRDVYFGFVVQPMISDSLYPVLRYRPQLKGYWPDIRTAYASNPADPGVTPFGFTLLSLPRPLAEIDYYFQYYTDDDIGDSAETDLGRYAILSGNHPMFTPPIRPDQTAPVIDINPFYLSFGPINDWAAGETLRVSFAFIGGQDLRYTPDNVYDNARAAQTLFARDYHPPFVLPDPKLRIESRGNTNILRWDPQPGDVNPEEAWDEYNAYIASIYPPDHWRRKDPPPGASKGGRVFEGYRLYRSEDPTGVPKSFTLIREWDMVDSVGPNYGYDVGLEHEFVDSNVVIGKSYWYSLSSFGIPDRQIIDYVDRDGTVKQETLSTSGQSLITTRKRVNVPFSPGEELGSVKVVPNPYRVDQNYTYESGGWEGRQRSWSEEDRLIRFIHLPPQCTIRIFSLTGDIVTTLYHDDPVRGELDWNLLSESGRAIASGLYVFSVESDYGRQVGKFVIIR
jgi:hypothetical protein